MHFPWSSELKISKSKQWPEKVVELTTLKNGFHAMLHVFNNILGKIRGASVLKNFLFRDLEQILGAFD